jgi:hypothetical protein
MAEIRTVTMDLVGRYADGSPKYRFHTSFPSSGVRLTGDAYPTREAAYEAAVAVVRAYEQRDIYGNMGEVIGVTQRQNGWHGVYNRYHSNT